MDTFLQYSTNKGKVGFILTRTLPTKRASFKSYSLYKEGNEATPFITYNKTQTSIYQPINTDLQSC